uniref:N-terminal acetyltransferase n=1 Tax=Cercospora zeae-maydis TaxID=135779 RepID=Q875K9_9PEZI|nr:N-terminal acetyltransferase [Cercospora zeae-maydis]
MAAIRPMGPMDLMKFNPCNLDHLTETYNIGFYLEYFTKWPHLCKHLSSPMTQDSKFTRRNSPTTSRGHAHITCLTVAPSARRLGYATKLSEALEQVGDQENAWFVDLFVRVENEAAIQLYKKMGYSVYRRITDYYNDGSDAYDMRKPLKRDKQRKTVRANGENIKVSPDEVW